MFYYALFNILDNSDRKMESKKPSKSRKKKTYSSTSEQSLLSEDQDEYSVTEYVMEYTGMKVYISIRQFYQAIHFCTINSSACRDALSCLRSPDL